MALLAVLWLTALAGGIAFMIATEIRLKNEAAVIRTEQLRARYLAVGGAQHALAQMLTALLVLDQEEYWQPDGTLREVGFRTGKAYVRVEAEADKISLNKASFAELEACFEHYQQTQAGAAIINALEERGVAADTDARQQGGENEYASLDQLLGIEDITRKMFFGNIGASPAGQGDSGNEDAGDDARPLVSMLTVHGDSEVCPALSEGQESQGDKDRRGPQDRAENEREEDENEPQLELPEGGEEQVPEEAGTEQPEAGEPQPSGQEEQQEDDTDGFQPNKVYSIFSTGQISQGAAPVTLWLVVRLSPSGGQGYTVLYSRIL